MLNKIKINYRLGLILGATILFTYILMVMGTFVTSTGSGLACPDWPLCYGSVAPPLEAAIWFEWGHRLLGGVSGILIIISTILIWMSYKGLPRIFTSSVLGLLLFGVLLGGLTVIVEAPLLESAAHVAIISSHLIIATLVLIFLIFTLRYIARGEARESESYFKLLFGAVYFQVLLGIIVRYSGATLACPDIPFCSGGLIPDTTNVQVLLQFFHRLTALLIVVVSASLLYRALKEGSSTGPYALTLGLIIAQAVFGIMIVVSSMFLPFIIMHAATGFFLLGYLAYKSMPYFFTRGVEPRGEAA